MVLLLPLLAVALVSRCMSCLTLSVVSSAAPTPPSACCPFGTFARPRCPLSSLSGAASWRRCRGRGAPLTGPRPLRVRTARVCVFLCVFVCFVWVPPACAPRNLNVGRFVSRFAARACWCRGHTHTLVGCRLGRGPSASSALRGGGGGGVQSVDGRRAAGEAAVARVAAAGRAVSLMLRSAPRGAVRRACVLGVLPSHAYAVAIPSPYLAVPLCRRGVMCTRYPPGCGVSTVWLPVGRVRDGRAGAVRGVCGHVVGLQGCRGAPVPAPPPPPSSPVCGGGGGGGGDVGARGWALRRRRGVGLRVCVTRGGCGGCEGLGGSHGGAWRVYAAPPLACAGGCNTTIWAGPLLVTPTVPRRRAQHGRSGAHGGEAHPLLPPPIFTNGTGENPGAEGGGGVVRRAYPPTSPV